MKTFATMIAVIFLSGMVYAQNESINLEQAANGYLASLNHQNPGVVASAISNLQILKQKHPELFVQENDINSENAADGYSASLNHQNPGVVSSAISNLMILNLKYPEQSYNTAIEELAEVSEKNTDEQIRMKARIAGNFLKNQEQTTEQDVQVTFVK